MAGDDVLITALYNGLKSAEENSDHKLIADYERAIDERRIQDLHRIASALESIAVTLKAASSI